MPSNGRHYEKSCQEFWRKDTDVYKCITCDSSHQLIICKNCFINGKHNGHDYRLITSLNGVCNCGHSSGSIFCATHPPIIKIDLPNDLYFNDIEVKKIIKITEIDENEAKYLNNLNQIKILLIDSTVWTLIKDYFERSQSLGQKPVKIKDIYCVNREEQEKAFIECGFDKQKRLLLWHGTKSKNLSGILKSGFRLPTKGQLTFGKGIYFADRVTKSCHYCDPTGAGILLLCEVSVGSMYRTGISKPYNCPPDNYNSIKGFGQYIPKPNVEQVFNNSIEVPIGPTVDKNSFYPNISDSKLNFNEYIIFEPKRILIKFIIHFEWS